MLDYDALQAAQQQSFDYAVFSGGGAKGVAYTGVLEALENSGVRDGLKGVAGSSAGAITAGFVAFGVSAEDFQEVFAKTNFKELGEGFLINKDTSKMQDMIHDTITDSLAKNLDPEIINQQCHDSLEAVSLEIESLKGNNLPDMKEKLESLKVKEELLQSLIDDPSRIEDLRDRAINKDSITFKDLSMLHTIDPKKFKELSVTAVNKETGELRVLNSKDSPDVEVATACRASSSLPRIFKPVEINGERFIDGGYRNNIPQDIYNKVENLGTDPSKIKEAKASQRTLVFAFGDSADENDPAKLAVYGSKEQIIDPNKLKKFAFDVVLKIVARAGGDFKYTQEETKVYNNLRENAQNAVILDTKIGTTGFDKAGTKTGIMHARGNLATARYLDNYEIGKEDLNLNRKEFLLDISEKLFDNKKVIAKNKEGEIGKVDGLAEYCGNESWKSNNKEDVLKSFVSDANDISPKALSVIIKTLNSKEVHSEVKQDFAEILDLKTDKNIDHYKFSKEDFRKKFSIKEQKSFVQKVADLASRLVGYVKKFRDNSALDNSTDIKKKESIPIQPLEEKQTNNLETAKSIEKTAKIAINLKQNDYSKDTKKAIQAAKMLGKEVLERNKATSSKSNPSLRTPPQAKSKPPLKI